MNSALVKRAVRRHCIRPWTQVAHGRTLDRGPGGENGVRYVESHDGRDLASGGRRGFEHHRIGRVIRFIIAFARDARMRHIGCITRDVDQNVTQAWRDDGAVLQVWLHWKR